MSELQTLIDQYGRLKDEADSYKKTLDADNNRIKELMIKDGNEKAEGSEYHVTCKAIESSKLNEEVLLNKLKEIGFTDCIKTKEYVDIDVLESAVYAGKIDAKILADCKEVSTTYRLNIYKNKE